MAETRSRPIEGPHAGGSTIPQTANTDQIVKPVENKNLESKNTQGQSNHTQERKPGKKMFNS